MREETLRGVERWWRSQLGVGDEMWSTTTVRQRDGEDGGWFVAWRQSGVHVMAPAAAGVSQLASVQEASVVDRRRPEFWHLFADRHGAEVIGPNVYRYLDEDPGAAHGVRRVAASELHALTAGVEPADLWESGFDVHLDAPGVVGFAADGGGAVLTDVDGAPRNVALLVTAPSRGRGIGTELGRAAASYAIRHHGWCRWRSSVDNLASSRTAERLGFEAYATQLALR